MHINFITLSIKLGLVILASCGLIGSFSRPARAICIPTLTISSWVVGVFVWLLCFATVVDIWGMAVAVIGLLFVGLGCMPLAVLATLFHGDWKELGIILAGFVAVFGSRILANVWDSATTDLASDPG